MISKPTDPSDDPVRRVALTMLAALKSLDGIKNQALCVLGKDGEAARIEPHSCQPPVVDLCEGSTVLWRCGACGKRFKRVFMGLWRPV